MKRYFCFLLILCIFLSIPCVAANSSVSDQASLLTTSQVADLEQEASDVYEQSGLRTIIVTVTSFSGQSAQTYAHNWLDRYFPNQDSILFLVSMSDREWAIVTQDKAADAISDWDIDDISDSVMPYLSDGEYYEAFEAFILLSANEYNSYLSGTGAQVDGELILTRLGIALLIGAVISLIVLLILRGTMNSARSQSGARNYMVAGSYDLLRCHDFYLYSHTTRVRKPENKSGSSGSRGGSRGGRSGRF